MDLQLARVERGAVHNLHAKASQSVSGKVAIMVADGFLHARQQSPPDDDDTGSPGNHTAAANEPGAEAHCLPLVSPAASSCRLSGVPNASKFVD